MKVCGFLLPFVLAFGIVQPAFSAFTITVTGTYDEQATQANGVDRSATTTSGNQLSQADFNSLISSAYAVGNGGVIDFDSLASGSVSTSPTDFLTARYGLANEKSLLIGNASPTAMSIATNNPNRTPISGANFLGKGGSVTDGDHFSFTFDEASQVIAVGATILSRESSPGNVIGEVTFSDGNTSSLTFSQTAGNGTDDLFFGFRVTEAQQASGIYITNLFFNPPDYRGLDDLAFVIAPEPGRAALVMLAIGAVFMRRRRIALCHVSCNKEPLDHA